MDTEASIFTERSTTRAHAAPERTGRVTAERTSWISWGAVFSGVVVGTAVQATLALLGIGIGASTVDPLQEANPLAGLGIGAMIWMFISTILSYFAAGWCAGRASDALSRANGTLHGVVTWGASTVAILLVVSGLVGGAASGLTRLLGSGAQMANALGVPSFAQENLPLDWIPTQSTSGFQSDQGAGQPVVNSLTGSATNAGNQPTKAQARQAGEKAAQGTTALGWFGFALLLLSALAAGLGGTTSFKTRYATTRP